MRHRGKYRKMKKAFKRGLKMQKKRNRNINRYSTARGGIRL